MITPSDTRLQAPRLKLIPADSEENAHGRDVTETWQWHLQHAIREPRELGEALGLDLANVQTEFPMLVPRPLLSRMQAGNAQDPLLLQVLPSAAENLEVNGYIEDPTGEQGLSGSPRGVLQKYQGRVLVTLTGACAINCRYCFRRHFPYENHQPDKQAWQDILDFLASHEDIGEVILSGGDPLVTSDRRLSQLLHSLDTIPHIGTVRFHTRLPVVIPQRVTDELVSALGQISKQVVIVLHVNHPNEIDQTVIDALSRLKGAGATLLNQTVLLHNVNDDVETLYRLSQSLFAAGILPYYLHALDPVAGSAHFDIPLEQGLAITEALQNRLPGYLVPRFVREVAGTAAKQLIHRV